MIKRVNIGKCASPQYCVTKKTVNNGTKKEQFTQVWVSTLEEAKKEEQNV